MSSSPLCNKCILLHKLNRKTNMIKNTLKNEIERCLRKIISIMIKVGLDFVYLKKLKTYLLTCTSISGNTSKMKSTINSTIKQNPSLAIMIPYCC